MKLFLDLLFPKFCLGCNKYGSYLCSTCQKKILQSDLVCPVCERPSIGGGTHPICAKKYSLDGLWFLGIYQDPLKKVIQSLKYRFVSDCAQTLVDLMINYWAYFTPAFFENIKKDPQSWIIVPVPLHRSRQRWRGFNQSALLAKLLSKKMELKYADALLRIKNTKPQAKLLSKDRKNNIKNAFILNSKFSIHNSNILLVDDVWTTGSTLKECCYMLKKGGAVKVWAITLAR